MTLFFVRYTLRFIRIIHEVGHFRDSDMFRLDETVSDLLKYRRLIRYYFIVHNSFMVYSRALKPTNIFDI